MVSLNSSREIAILMLELMLANPIPTPIRVRRPCSDDHQRHNYLNY